ncbi:MAG TPA: archaeosortase/exosortase family protein [Luteolibacter sp.]|nr:archaeosortase/exosortase family protein [Luteolibacter sp.]
MAAALAFALATLPVLAWYVRRALDGSDEPLGVVALVAAVATIAVSVCYGHRDRERVSIDWQRLWIGAAALAAIQLSGSVRWPLVVGLLAVLTIAWAVLMPRGKAGVVVLLVLSLPWIATLDFYAGYPLRVMAASLAHGLLGLAGVTVERAGVVLLDGGRMVGIDPPCAGIRMLWTACFVAAVFAARLRLSWPRTLTLLGIAVACVVVGNGVRAAVVFLPESGRVSWPEWAHPGVGLMIHVGVLAAVSASASRFARVRSSSSGQRGVRLAFAAVALLACASLLIAGVSRPAAAPVSSSVDWPAAIDGVPLVALPPTDAERSFARSFPGAVGRFACGDAEIILRRSAGPTRMMHPAAHCLRAAGFVTHSEPLYRDADGRTWGQLRATRDGHRFRVLERYENVAGTCSSSDASAWFWQALARPDQGPWLGITRIEIDDGK